MATSVKTYVEAAEIQVSAFPSSCSASSVIFLVLAASHRLWSLDFLGACGRPGSVDLWLSVFDSSLKLDGVMVFFSIISS